MTPILKSPLAYTTRPGRWKYLLTASLVIDLMLPLRGNHVFIDSGVTIARLDGPILTIFEDYAWDGCSPSCDIFGRRIGTPTPASSLLASLVHDVLYQFSALACAPYTRSQADTIFYDLMRAQGFRLAAPYHAAVAIFGGIFRRLSTASKTTRCLTHL